MPTDPIAEFRNLFEKARSGEPDATACALATATPQGAPSVRIVLLKSVSDKGFTFFTNYESRKAAEIAANPQVSLCFYWPSTHVQVRVEGGAARIAGTESAEYFATRPRESQLGAWASRQSSPLGSREELEARFQEVEARFAGQDVPLPQSWGGYLLTPERIEIWRAGNFRLHDRVLYTRSPDGGWSEQRLYP